MTVTRERFEQGMTYDEYKAQMTRNQDRFEENERSVRISDDNIQFFSQLPQTLSVLVIAEDWCGDVINNVPILGKLAAQSGKLDLRVFLRDQNTDLIDQYLKDGQFRSIPVFVFFDEDFRELGPWIERPQIIYQRQREMLDDLYANDPIMKDVARSTSPAEMSEEARTRLSQAQATFRGEIQETSRGEVVREIREIISRALAPAV